MTVEEHDDHCVCGWRIVVCHDCGDDRCLRCDPYMAHADCRELPHEAWRQAKRDAAPSPVVESPSS